MEEKIDYIIVGQGIAGSMVAHSLLKHGKKILVIDKFNPNASSNIAAGVVNPITGRRIVKTWIIDEILPFAKKTYKALEQQLGISFFYEQDIYKIFSSQEDIDIWDKKLLNSEYHNYLGDIIADLSNENISTPYGAGVIKQGCWMDVPMFTKAYRAFLNQQDSLLEEEFDFNSLMVNEYIQYKNFTANRIIFCEGYRAYLNPYFKWVSFSLAKGEHFVIQAHNLNSTKIINKNIFIIPKGNNHYNVGSTFIWDDLTEVVTDDGRTEVLTKLERIIKTPYAITEEKAGIRPTIIDRRPVVGNHPVYKNIYIFNGMGTKGVSMAPYLSSHLVENLLFNSPILDEISVNRFEV